MKLNVRDARGNLWFRRLAHGLVGFGCIGSLVTGCGAPTGVRDASSHSQNSRSPVVSPLSVSVADPAQLATVNSVVIAPPEFEASARSVKLDERQVSGLVESVALRELDIKVLGEDWASKNLSVLPLPLNEMSRGGLRRAGVDGVVRTEILEYIERVGSAVGGDPAAVAFRLSVLRVSDGRAIWQSTYSYRQEALTDNLLKIGDRFGKDGAGPGWTTGMAALERGFNAALRDFRTRREQQFLVQKR